MALSSHLELGVVLVRVCVESHASFCFCYASRRNYMIIDPTWQEERVMDGALTVAMNVHREVCLLSTSGTVPLTTEQVSTTAVGNFQLLLAVM